jgi:alpha-glucosidase
MAWASIRTHCKSKINIETVASIDDQHSMLNTTNYTRTIWNRDAYRIPEGSNLYGAHPVYYDHRGDNGTHAVFLLNSDGIFSPALLVAIRLVSVILANTNTRPGIEVKIDDSHGQFLEYNTLGGIIDLYFVSGPTPVEAAQQYSEVVGKTAMMPYWGFGFHQCRYGMRDVYEVAEVVANYSKANIPLETMWVSERRLQPNVMSVTPR